MTSSKGKHVLALLAGVGAFSWCHPPVETLRQVNDVALRKGKRCRVGQQGNPVRRIQIGCGLEDIDGAGSSGYGALKLLIT